MTMTYDVTFNEGIKKKILEIYGVPLPIAYINAIFRAPYVTLAVGFSRHRDPARPEVLWGLTTDDHNHQIEAIRVTSVEIEEPEEPEEEKDMYVIVYGSESVAAKVHEIYGDLPAATYVREVYRQPSVGGTNAVYWHYDPDRPEVRWRFSLIGRVNQPPTLQVNDVEIEEPEEKPEEAKVEVQEEMTVRMSPAARRVIMDLYGTHVDAAGLARALWALSVKPEAPSWGRWCIDEGVARWDIRVSMDEGLWVQEVEPVVRDGEEEPEEEETEEEKPVIVERTIDIQYGLMLLGALVMMTQEGKGVSAYLARHLLRELTPMTYEQIKRRVEGGDE